MSAIAALQSYGLTPEDDMSHPYQPDLRQARPNEFYALASGYLRYIEQFVRQEVVPEFLAEPTITDRWNPAGYMVYALGRNSLIGTVRLNVWPAQEQRKANPEGPHIHDQAWHSVSMVLAGEYRENNYDIVPADEPQEPKLKTYTHRRIEDDDVFETNGDYAQVVQKGMVRRLPGKLHYVEAGRYIQSNVESSAMILSVNSHPVRSRSNVILPDRGHYFTSRRAAITAEDVEIARELLLPK